MADKSRPARPYHGRTYALGLGPRGETRNLSCLAKDEAKLLGSEFAAMDPWASYQISPARLADFFDASEEGCSRRAIRVDGELAGVVVVRSPWLHGPYLQFLGLRAGWQGHGLGAAVLAWMADEAPAGTRNLWLCVSAINVRARAFYEAHGYRLAASLEGLAADHMDELLLRREVRSAG